MKEYKKCECLACGNIFPSTAKKIKCRNGSKKGCNSTKCVVLDIKKSIEAEQNQDVEVKNLTSNDEMEVNSVEDQEEESGFFF